MNWKVTGGGEGSGEVGRISVGRSVGGMLVISSRCCVSPGTIESTLPRVRSHKAFLKSWNKPAVLITSSIFLIDSNTASFYRDSTNLNRFI